MRQWASQKVVGGEKARKVADLEDVSAFCR